MFIVKALAEDSEALTALTIESKSFWNYSEEQIKAWTRELTITADYINAHEVVKLVHEDQLVGYYSFYENNAKEVILDNLFVAPNSIGEGFGRRLLIHFLEAIKEAKYQRVIVYSDPNSERFYAHFGFEVIGQEPTSIKNRFLPILRLEVE